MSLSLLSLLLLLLSSPLSTSSATLSLSPNQIIQMHSLANPASYFIDRKPPYYLGKFADCNGASSVKDFGTKVDVKPIKKFWNKPEAKDDRSNPTHVVE